MTSGSCRGLFTAYQQAFCKSPAEFYLRPLPIQVAASGPPAQPKEIDQTPSPASTSQYTPRPLSGLFNPAQPAPGNKGIVPNSNPISSSPRPCPPVEPSASHRQHQTPRRTNNKVFRTHCHSISRAAQALGSIQSVRECSTSCFSCGNSRNLVQFALKQQCRLIRYVNIMETLIILK